MSLYSTKRLHALRMIVTGGGTGGHTYPALTTINALQARLTETGTTAELLWVGIAGSFEATIAARNSIPFRAITTGKLRRSPNPRELARNVADAFRIPLGIVQAALTVARTRPAVVFSTGGFVSVPIGLAAALFRVPYLMHEQTLSVGLANRILARVATRILLSHEASIDHLPPRARRRAVVTGNPVRPAVLNGNPARGLAAFGLDPVVPLVLVTGGASGALQINRMLAGTLPDLLQHCQIVHQCGSHSHAEMQQVAQALPAQVAHRYHVVDFIHDELPDLLAAAAIVVARSGAGTVAELTALGKAAILVPYPVSAGDEQRITARHLAHHGAAVMLDGDQATPDHLHTAITALLADPDRRTAMSQTATTHGRPDAAARVVTEILTVSADQTQRR
jgi:UDP-N-acetylglucosamine--N-acetylmuramyl-(pentapeptide) pyrophosphoryl-undecaprenol N-acetylglucosamine transferase